MNGSRLRNERYDDKLQPILAQKCENNLITGRDTDDTPNHAGCGTIWGMDRNTELMIKTNG